jgi:pyruvate,orthophosphate dikinase
VAYVYAFDHDHGLPLADVASIVGGKAANIGVMARDLDLPVPPAFVISTVACRSYLESGWPEGLDDEIRAQMGGVEEAVGRRFGDPEDPLLVSVRSGAPVSMPGMMDTILNLGLNDDTAAGLAEVSGAPEFAAECRSRFVGQYRDIVGEPAPDDPWRQLRGAIEAVFRSWNGERAKSYREREGIPDDLGTGVIVQAMVFGNRGSDSGTGVLFTRNPATGEAALYGDVMFNAQGEDVVAGTHQTEDIAVLDERMPAVGAELRRIATSLEYHYADVCDIEFTIEEGRLWMLQTRIGKRSPQAALRIAIEMAEDDSFPLARLEAVERVAKHLIDPPVVAAERADDVPPIATGLAASPGIAAGAIATTPEAAVAMAEEGESVVLVRRETSPDDVHGMSKAVGILTSTGGLASHAAVVARGWGLPAVVGASAVHVREDGVEIGGRLFAIGEAITLDGTTGEVFPGAIARGGTVAPEAAKLRRWASELGLTFGEPSGSMPVESNQSATSGEVTREGVLRALLIKGFAMPEGLAEAFLADLELVSRLLDDLVSDGLAEPMGGMYALSDEGKQVGGSLIESDREQWGVENADAALDDLIPLDQKMKDVVTRWQMREFKGAQIINDHADPEHDAAVLTDFTDLHADAERWLSPLTRGLARLEEYAARLERAAGRVAQGGHDYIASPMVDSYHNVWFELHEDLILLAGRNRADEVAAGRA